MPYDSPTSMLQAQNLVRNTNDPLQKFRMGVIRLFTEAQPLLAAMPIVDLGGAFSYHYQTESSIGTVNNRVLNEGLSYTQQGGVTPSMTDVRVYYTQTAQDRLLDNNPVLRASFFRRTVNGTSEAMASRIIDDIFNSNAIADPAQIDGLRQLITPAFVYPADLATPTDDGPLSLRTLDIALGEGNGIRALFMGTRMYQRFTEALRNESFGGRIVATEKSFFGVEATQYGSVVLVPLKRGILGRQILDFDEIGFGATATTTTIFGLNLNEDAVTLIQNTPLQVYNTDTQATDALRTISLEWAIQLVVHRHRDAFMIRGITDASIVK